MLIDIDMCITFEQNGKIRCTWKIKNQKKTPQKNKKPVPSI